MTQQVKNLPAMQETQGIQVQSLGWEDSPGGNGNPLQHSYLKNPTGKKPWIFIGMTDAEAEVPILQPPNMKNQLTEKDPDTGKEWRQKEKGTVQDAMVRQHYRLNGYDFEQTPRDSGGKRRQVCCSPGGCKELDI